jgi:hypothetical protein
MKPADEIEKRVKKMSFKADREMDKRLWFETSKARNESHKTMLAPSRHNIRRTIMKSPIAKLAAAAAVIIVVALGLFELIGDGSTSSVAWAEVVQKVEASRGVIYRTRTAVMGDSNDDWPEAHIMHYKSPLHSRTDWYRGDQIQRTVNFDLGTRTMTWLAHDEKVHHREPMKEEAIQSVQKDQSPWLNPGDFMSRVLSFKHWNIGTRMIDGILCEGLETNDPAVCGAPPDKTFVGRLWVSVETRYPVLIEVEAAHGQDGSSRMFGCVDQFEWDVEFGPSDRDISIPPGFRPLHEEDKEIESLRQQGKRELLKVEETLSDGAIVWKVHVYKYELSDGQIKEMREGGDGMPVYSQDQFAELKPKLDEFRQLRKAGPGEYLGTSEQTVEDRVFTFKREKYLLSDGTEFIWSVGTPK